MSDNSRELLRHLFGDRDTPPADEAPPGDRTGNYSPNEGANPPPTRADEDDLRAFVARLFGRE